MATVHVANLGLVKIKPDGTPYHRGSSTRNISECLNFSEEHRIFPNNSNPNTEGYPTLEDYLNLEAADGYIPQIVNQSMVITYHP